MISSLALLAGTSFLLALLITPLCRGVFQGWGFVDRPDGGRHRHPRPIPRVGGIAVLAAYLGAFAVLAVYPAGWTAAQTSGVAWIYKICLSAALVFATGMADDLRGLQP